MNSFGFVAKLKLGLYAVGYAAFIDARTHTHIIAHISEIAQRTHSTETFISKIASIGY